MNKMTTNFLTKIKVWWDKRKKWQKFTIVLLGLCLLISGVAGATKGC